MGGQRRRQMPEKEQRKEREREEKTEHRIRKLLEERRRAPGGPRWGGLRGCKRLYLACQSLGEQGQTLFRAKKRGRPSLSAN